MFFASLMGQPWVKPGRDDIICDDDRTIIVIASKYE